MEYGRPDQTSHDERSYIPSEIFRVIVSYNEKIVEDLELIEGLVEAGELDEDYKYYL